MLKRQYTDEWQVKVGIQNDFNEQKAHIQKFKGSWNKHVESLKEKDTEIPTVKLENP